MAAPASELPSSGAPIPLVDLTLQLISGQSPPDGVVTAPASACHHAQLIEAGLEQLLERKTHLSKGFLSDSLDLNDGPCETEDKEFLSKALLSFLDVLQQLEDAQDTQDVLKSYLSVTTAHIAAGANITSVDTLRHVVTLLKQIEDPSGEVEVSDLQKLLEADPALQPDEDLEANMKALPEMAMLYRNLVEGSEARWRAKAEALEELGRCWRRHHSLTHGVATKKLVNLVSPAPAGAAQARNPMAGMAGMMGMGGMGGMGGPPAPVSKEELSNVEVDADLDLIRVIETSTIAKDLAAARDKVATLDADDGGLLSGMLYQDLNDEKGLELLVYLRLVRALTDYLKGDHEQGLTPLSELAQVLKTGKYSSGRQSQLSPPRLRELAQEALGEVLRAFRHVLHPDPKTSEEMCKTLATPLGILVSDPDTFLTAFPEAQAAAAQKQAEEEARNTAAAAEASAASAAPIVEEPEDDPAPVGTVTIEEIEDDEDDKKEPEPDAEPATTTETPAAEPDAEPATENEPSPASADDTTSAPAEAADDNVEPAEAADDTAQAAQGEAADADEAQPTDAGKAEAEETGEADSTEKDGSSAAAETSITEAIVAAVEAADSAPAPTDTAGERSKVTEEIEAAVGTPVEKSVAPPVEAETAPEDAGEREADTADAEPQAAASEEKEQAAPAPSSPSISWSVEDLVTGSVLVDLELELRQYQLSPDPTSWKLVLGMRAAALQLQHALEQQPVSVDSFSIASQSREGQEYGAIRGLLLLEALKAFAVDAAREAGRESEATALLLELLVKYPHEQLGWTEDSDSAGVTDARIQTLKGLYDELESLLQKISQVEGWALTSGYIHQLSEVLQQLLGTAPLYELPEGVYNTMAAHVASLFEVQELECPQVAQLELWQLLKQILNDENPLQSELRGCLLAVLALDDADERSDALRELWGSMSSGEDVEVEPPAFDDDSPVRYFDPIDAALQLVSSVTMALAAVKQLPPPLQGMEVLVTSLRKVQKAVLKLQPLFQTEEEHRLMEQAAEEADLDRERAASLITDKDEFRKEVTGKIFSLLRKPASHPQPAERLQALLDLGANLQEVQEGLSVVHVAVATGDRQLLTILLNAGADVNKRSLPLSSDISTLHCERALLSPLDFAALIGNWQAAELLLRHGATVSPDPETGLSPLHHAVSFPAQSPTPQLLDNKKVVVSLLLKRRCPVNAATQDGKLTPLLLAVRNRLAPLVQALLKGKADVNKTDEAGLSPLHYLLVGPQETGAAAQESKRVLRLLLAHGAKTNQGPFLDDPALAALDLSPHHWELPRSIQVLRSFGTPDAVIANVAAAPTTSFASLLYTNVVQRVAAVAGSRLNRYTRDVWWHDREAANNFRKRIKLAVANSFHVKLTPYRLALLNEKWELADILKPATPGASRLQAPLAGHEKSAKLQVAVGDTLREATVLENQHGYQYLLTHEPDHQARSNRRLQLAGLAPWVRRKGYLVLQPKVADWVDEAFDWSQGADPDMAFQMQLADKHDLKVGYTKRRDYSTVASEMVRVLDLSKVPDQAHDIKSYGQALLHVLPAFSNS